MSHTCKCAVHFVKVASFFAPDNFLAVAHSHQMNEKNGWVCKSTTFVVSNFSHCCTSHLHIRMTLFHYGHVTFYETLKTCITISILRCSFQNFTIDLLKNICSHFELFWSLSNNFKNILSLSQAIIQATFLAYQQSLIPNDRVWFVFCLCLLMQ